MKKNLTELVFILDRSGSMAGLEADTIGGFNAMLQKQRGEPGEAVISTVLFDNETEVLLPCRSFDWKLEHWQHGRRLFPKRLHPMLQKHTRRCFQNRIQRF